MIKGTTPTHKFSVPLARENIKKIKITYEQDGDAIVTKREGDCDVSDGAITVKLTQEDTFKFDHEKLVSVQIRILTTNDDAISSYPFSVNAVECLDSEVL